ncbi:MAG: phosphate ABC transporter permease [Spirochaetes bacterium GWD1_27_9]|nr:MAG: phosphate ABC transporter permease [Spirochaetes bacterium GWB1_27_13]OHD24215.1 MAG: phosphate ABC transporter permease [Spirochaetes bacterium GWC1_27_15]OHD33618.1 MAG: phosphate ABC transporter permease [Spirochaetes bacterium GWD1_27_9]
MEKKEQILTIEAGKTEKHYWADLWKYRELFLFLSWRDILVRYKQTVIGILWSILRPFVTMIIFTIVFGKLAKFPSYDIPYPIFVFLGMLPWQFFANSFSEASNSLISNSNIISKIYFPRIIIPTTSVIVSLIDFFISFLILAGLCIFYQFIPSYRIIFVPLFLILAFSTSIGFGLIIASLNVKYRDFRYIVPFIVQLGLYISPVGFTSAVIPEKFRFLYALNPMVGVIDGFRWAFTGKTQINVTGLAISIILSIFLLIFGIYYFRKTEKSFADII